MLDPTPNIAPEVQLPEPASTGKRTLSSEELVAGLRAMGVEVEMMPMHDSEPGATADQAPAANPSVIVAKPTPVAKAEPKPAESTEPSAWAFYCGAEAP